VCKGWRALISDQAFVAAQRSRATGPFIVAMFGFAPEHELRLLDKGGNVLRAFDIRGSSVMLAPTHIDLIFLDRAQLGAMIIDPASGREFTVVGTNDPPPPAWWDKSPTSRTGSDYSFGRAAASGDYKVLRLHVFLSLWHDLRHWCEVATIMDGGAEPTWRRRPWGPFYDTSFSQEHKATVNGVLYFLPSNTYSASHARNRVAAFDLESEEWKPEMIKCPPLQCKEDQWHMSVSLTELKGTLCVVHNILRLDSYRGCYVYIWLLMDPNKSIWDKKYRIQMPERSLIFTEPLDILDDGTILLLLNASRKAGNGESYHRYILQFYNFGNETFTDTDYMEMPEGFIGTMTFYTGSLLS
jgi:F-box interacting protein